MLFKIYDIFIALLLRSEEKLKLNSLSFVFNSVWMDPIVVMTVASLNDLVLDKRAESQGQLSGHYVNLLCHSDT